MLPCVDLCMCVCVFVCVGSAPAARVPLWHSCIGTEASGTPAGPPGISAAPQGLVSTRVGVFQSPRKTTRGGSCSPGRHQRARVQRKTNPSALESMPTAHTHTHNTTTWKQPTAVLQNHLISFTVYKGFSVGEASLLNL